MLTSLKYHCGELNISAQKYKDDQMNKAFSSLRNANITYEFQSSFVK